MKTTVEISDPLLREVRRLAARHGVTLRTLIERGLRLVVAETKGAAPFKLRRASFKGESHHPDLRDASWDAVRDRAYEGPGGGSASTPNFLSTPISAIPPFTPPQLSAVAQSPGALRPTHLHGRAFAASSPSF